MDADQVNAEIRRVLGDVPLRAGVAGDRIFLADGRNEPVELETAGTSEFELFQLLYDWAVFVGWTNEDWEDFLEGGTHGTGH